MAGFREYLIAFMMAGLFLLVMINFVINMARDNNAQQSIQHDPIINSTFHNLNVEIENIQRNTTAAKDSWEKETISQQIGDLLFGSVKIIGIILGGTIKGFYAIFRVFAESKVLGIPSIVVTYILSIVSLTVLLLGWRLLKRG